MSKEQLEQQLQEKEKCIVRNKNLKKSTTAFNRSDECYCRPISFAQNRSKRIRTKKCVFMFYNVKKDAPTYFHHCQQIDLVLQRLQLLQEQHLLQFQLQFHQVDFYLQYYSKELLQFHLCELNHQNHIHLHYCSMMCGSNCL